MTEQQLYPEKQIVLVTGANRGIGKEVCRQLSLQGFIVILTSKEFLAAEKAAQSLQTKNTQVVPFQLDVTLPESVSECYRFVKNSFGALHVLINNAGIYLDRPSKNLSLGIADLGDHIMRKTFEVNFFGTVRMIQAFLPMMKEQNFGRIVNVSSGMGRFHELDWQSPYYRTSKTAVNSITRIVASEVKDFDILVNAVCPGWVKTDMGGINAVRSVEQGAYGIVIAATLPKRGITGALLRDGENFGW